VGVNYAVKTKFDAVDGMSKVFAHMEKSGARFGKGVKKEMDLANAGLKSFKSVFTGIMASRVVTGALGALRNQIGGIIDEFLTFENALVSTASRMDIVKDSRGYGRLEKEIRKIGSTTEYTNTQVALASEVLGQAGFKDINIAMQAVKSSSDLATIAQTDLAEATKISVNALASFGLKTSDSVKNVENLTRVNNAFSRATDASTIGIEQLFETMSYSASTIKESGDPLAIETFAALAAIVGEAGVTGSKAGTAINQSYLKLIDPVGKAVAQIKKFNIVVEDAKTGDMLDQMTILANMADKFKDLGTRKKMQAVSRIFDVRAMKGVLPVLALGSEKIMEFRDKIILSGKTAEQKAQEMRQSLEKQKALIESAKIDLGFKFIDKTRDALPKIIDGIISLINSVNVDKWAFAFDNIKITLGEIYDGLVELKPWIQAVGMMWAVAKVIAFGKVIGAMIVGIKAFGVASMGALGPFYFMVFGLTALVMTVQKHWDDLGRSISYAFELIGNAIQDMFVSILKGMAAMVRNSWLGTLLVKLGIVSKEALAISDVVIDKMFGRKVYKVKVRPIMANAVNSQPVSRELNFKDVTAATSAYGIFSGQTTFNSLPPSDIKAPSLSKSARSEIQTKESVKGSWTANLNIPNPPPGTNVSDVQSSGAPPLNVNIGQN